MSEIPNLRIRESRKSLLFVPNESKFNKTLNLFEHFRPDERNKSREYEYFMPYKEEEDDSQRKFLRAEANGTNK